MVRKILKNPHYKTADILVLDHGLFRWDNDHFAPADAENSATLYQKSRSQMNDTHRSDLRSQKGASRKSR